MVKKVFQKTVPSEITPLSGKHHTVLFVAIAIIASIVLCVGAVAGDCPHIDESWTPISGIISSASFSSGNNYYLDDNATISGDLNLNGEIQLCLNGYKLDLAGKHIVILSGGNLSLYDCGSRVWQFNDKSDDDGLWVVLDDGVVGTYSLAGGIITNGFSGSAGGIHVKSGGKFTMWGGNIVGNRAQNGGGGVETSGLFTLEGGNITGNKVLKVDDGNGGGVCAWEGTFVMNNGNITKNTANLRGGGVYVDGKDVSSSFTMNGGNITENKAVLPAKGDGGGVCVSNKINGNTFTLNGGNISKNSASNGGAGVCIYAGSVFTMFGGNITENIATGTGGGMEVSGTATMRGGTISKNIGGKNGGGICIWGANGLFTMNGGSITENTVSGNYNGGGIFVTSNGRLTVSGGEISENMVSNGQGGGIYFDVNSITISGTAVIKDNKKGSNINNIYLVNNKYLTVGEDGLVDGSSIYVTTQNTIGPSFPKIKIAVNAPENNARYLHADAGISVATSQTGSDISFEQSTEPDPDFEPTEHSHPDDPTTIWYGWNSSITHGPRSAHHFVLTENVELESDWVVNQRGTIYLCLNGNVLDLNGHYISVEAKSELVICDCEDTTHRFDVDSYNGNVWVLNEASGAEVINGGVITGGTGYPTGGGNTKGAGVFVNDGTLTVLGGNIVGNKAETSGGGVYVNKGSFTLAGGNITGNSATWGGGGVEVYGDGANSLFTMTGGKISSNTVSVASGGKGGGIYIGVRGSVTMTGGEIVDNIVVNGVGGGVCFEGGDQFAIGKKVKIMGNTASSVANNVYLYTGKTMQIANRLESGSQIGVTTKTFGAWVKVATNAKAAEASYFNPDRGAPVTSEFSSNSIYLHDPTIPDFEPTDHRHDGDDPSIVWKGWSSSETRGPGPSESDETYYVLTEDVTLSAEEWEVPNGITHLCLNGHVLNISENFIVPDKSTLIIHDCKFGNESHTHNFTLETVPIVWYNDTTYRYETATYDNFWKWDNTSLDSQYSVMGGVITGGNPTRTDNDRNGGAIRVDKGGTLIMYAGNLVGNRVNQSTLGNGAGGAVYCRGTFTMYDGNIIGNAAGAGGGGVQPGGTTADYSKRIGNFNMHNGNITYNFSPRFGGGVCIWSSNFTMLNGVIANNTATVDGGGVFVEWGDCFVHDGLIQDNSANYGGGICVFQGGNLELYGCTITNNTAVQYGGGISPFGKAATVAQYGKITLHESNVPIIVEGNHKGDERCDVYVSPDALIKIPVGDVLAEGSRLGVKPNQERSDRGTIIFANTTRYENEKYFFADLSGDFEPFYDGDGNALHLYSKTEHDPDFEPSHEHYHPDLPDITWYEWNESAKLVPHKSGYYVLTEDVKLSNEMLEDIDPELEGSSKVWNITGEAIHICLNGHVLSLNNTRIRVSSVFFINDCNGDHGEHYFDVKEDGMWNLTRDTTDILVHGGVITGNHREPVVSASSGGFHVQEYGGAIRTVNGSVVMKGGTIAGNRAGVGGGIYVQGGRLTIENGSIMGNSARLGGGGVEIKNAGRFEMDGGVVANNTVTLNGTAAPEVLLKGGGICLGVNDDNPDAVYFVMKGGVVRDNKVENNIGSGVFIDTIGEVSVSGDAVIDRSNEFYINNIGTPVEVFGNSFTGGIQNLSGNMETVAEGNIIVEVMQDALDSGITAESIKDRFTIGSRSQPKGISLQPMGDSYLVLHKGEPEEIVRFINITDSPDNATIYIEGKEKGLYGKYEAHEHELINITTNLQNRKYVFCNYTVVEDISKHEIETQSVSRNATHSIRNFTMPAADVTVDTIFGLRGDADYDGEVNIVDAACVGVHIIRGMGNPLILPGTNGYLCADVNDVNDIDVLDLLEINRYLVGIKAYPGENIGVS